MIKIRHAEYLDLIEIKLFLKKYWNENHVLVRDQNIFNHYFLNEKTNVVQFFLGLNDNDIIQGVLGYITNKQYDEDVSVNGAWLSMWKVIPNLHQPLGMQLLHSLESELDVDFVASFGINKQTIPIYKKLGFLSGHAQQYYFDLANPQKCELDGWDVVEGIKENFKNKRKFSKSTKYLKNKFIKLEFYNYKCFSIYKNSKLICQLVGRILFDPESKTNIYRVVDYVGSVEGISKFSFFQKKYKTNLEIDYIDIFLQDTSSINNLLEGFSLCNEFKYTPVYFEPFNSLFAKKYFCFKPIKGKISNIKIVTGDCDQDRPNKL